MIFCGIVTSCNIKIKGDVNYMNLLKINALIAALTLETISDMTVLGVKTEKIRLLQGLRC